MWLVDLVNSNCYNHDRKITLSAASSGIENQSILTALFNINILFIYQFVTLF